MDQDMDLSALLAEYLPGREVTAVRDRGEWVRRIFEVTLDGGEVVFVKFHQHADWLDATEHTRQVCALLRARGLQTPELIAVDSSRRLAPYPFVIERKGAGVRLDRLLGELDAAGDGANRRAVFQACGRYYRAMHSIPGPRLGAWIDDPRQPFDMTPNDFFLRNEIEQGSGAALAATGRLARESRERAAALWREYLPALNAQPAVMVHGSPFRWAISLEYRDGWQVSRLSSLGDVLWWDAAFDLAAFRYPPFAEARAEDWEAFCDGYGPVSESALPVDCRVRLYALLQRLMAANGNYYEPKTPENVAWREQALEDFEKLMG